MANVGEQQKCMHAAAKVHACSHVDSMHCCHQLVAHACDPARGCRNSLGASGVADGDVLQMVPAQAMQQMASGQQGGAVGGRAGGSDEGNIGKMNPDGSAENPIVLMQQIKSNAHMLASLQENNPPLAK